MIIYTNELNKLAGDIRRKIYINKRKEDTIKFTHGVAPLAHTIICIYDYH